VSEAFKKGKELESYMSIVPRQQKAGLEQYQSIKQGSKNLGESIELSIEEADEECLIRPKESGLDSKTFN
jgi:hypothetical protein